MLRIGVIMYQTSLTKGQELVAQRMVREFRRQGYDAFLITSIYHDWQPVVGIDDVRRRGGYIHAFDETLGIPVVRVNSENTTWPPRRISFVDFMGVIASIVDELKLNVLITHSTLWNGPEEVMKFVKWMRNLVKGGAPDRPLIFCYMSHLQEPSDERYAIYERSYREAWNSTVLPQMIGEADFILVTTPYETELMKRLGTSDEKILLFPGGIDEEAITSSGSLQEFKARHKLPGSAKMVSFLGTVEERKNVLALLEVAKLLSKRTDIHFVIAGKPEGEYGDKVKQEALKLRNVSLLDSISEEDKAALIKTSFLNITMSRAEALGISQLEFMSMGVPVITSGVGGQSWIVRDGVNGLVLDGPEDVKGAADAVVRLVDHQSLRDKFGKRAAQWSSGFSITRLIHQLSKKLEDALQKYYHGTSIPQGMPGEERIVEAWVNKGQKVAATSKRLIVRSVERGRDVISIPYSEIAKVVRYVKAPWPVLGLGISATFLLLASRILGLGIISSLSPGIEWLFSGFGLSSLTKPLVTMMPFIPFVVSVAAFSLALKEGYLIHYGASKKIFLPKEFLKALRLADKLTPNNLFADEAEVAVVHG